MKPGREKRGRRSILLERVWRVDKEAFRSELFQYRHETKAMLRKYLAVSTDLGRLPSTLGGEMFRARVTSYRLSTFEDLVVFVTDMNACLERMCELERRFLVMNIFQDFTVEEIAARLRFGRNKASRIYCDALDQISEILLRFRLLDPMDWIGDQIASEGWFEGCPILRSSTWAESLPPKKPAQRLRNEEVQILFKL